MSRRLISIQAPQNLMNSSHKTGIPTTVREHSVRPDSSCRLGRNESRVLIRRFTSPGSLRGLLPSPSRVSLRSFPSHPLKKMKPLALLSPLIGLLALSLHTASAQTLTQGPLSLQVRTDNGAIDTVTFNSVDFFNPGSPVSDFGFQVGTDTTSFKYNNTAGLTQIPAAVVASGSQIVTSGTYSYGAATIGFSRTHVLVPGQNVIRITTTLTNTGSNPTTIRYFDAFDPDQGPGSSSTANDVIAIGGVNVVEASAANGAFVLGSSASGAGTMVTAVSGTLAIASGTQLNALYSTPFDPAGATADIGTAIIYERLIPAGSSQVLETLLAFGNSSSTAQAAFSASTTNLDPSFSGDGIQITPFMDGATLRASIAQAVGVQPDGKIVAAGQVDSGGQSNFALARYLPDGTLDPLFGTGGMVTTALSAANDFARGLEVLPDGKILVAGNAVVSGSIRMALARYLANGTLDSTFGTGGFRTYDLGSGDDVCEDLAIAPDGKIVMAGANAGATDDFAVLRCLADGTPDTSFGVNGVITSSFGSSTDVISSVVVQPDGRIVVGGQSYNGSKYVFAIVRYTVTGGIDTSFGGGGVSTSFGSGNDVIKALALQPDGKILAGGYSFQSGSNDMAFARYQPDGTLDTTFDTDGKRIVSFVSGNDFCTGMTIQPDGRVVCVGYGSNGMSDDMAVLRLSPDGTLDTTFDSDGKLTIIPGPQSDQLYSVALSQDGDIVAAGLSQNASGISQFAVVRLIGPFPSIFDLTGVQSNDRQSVRISGQIDPAGSSTTVTVEYGPSAALGSSFSLGTFTGNGLQSFNGTFGFAGGLVLGTTYHYRVIATNSNGITTSSIQTLVYAPGARDFTFSGDGVQITPFVSGSAVRTSDFRAVAVQPDGKIVAVGFANNGSNDDSAIARYLPDGTLDNSFATGGLATMAIGPTVDQFFAIALQPDGKIVAAGLSWNGSRFVFALARYLANGSPDPSFDGDGVATYAPGNGDAQARGVLVQSDGKIVASGYATVSGNQDAAFVRVLSNGTLDTSFSSDGVFTTPIATGYDCANDIAQLPDGKLMAAIQSYTNSVGDFGLLRLNTNGTLDTSFDGDGKLLTDYIGSEDYAAAIAIQPDGKIVTGGAVHFGGSNYDFALIRYHPNGALDTTFDGDGKISHQFGPGHDDIRDIVLQPDGRIVCVGNTNNGSNLDMAVARLNPDGSLDATFDGDGRAVLAPGSGGDLLFGVALAPSGAIVGVGISENFSSVAQFAVVRLLGGPSDLLVNGGFESQEALGGGASTGFGDWKEDQAGTVGAENGITPYEGSRMLKFLGTSLTGGSTDIASEVGQFVPMSAFAAEIAAGSGVRVVVTGRFNCIAATDSFFRIELVGFNGTPANLGTVTTWRAQAFETDSNTATWETLSNFIDLPPGTTMVLARVTAVENITNDPTSPEFGGNYADGIQLTVQTDFTAPTFSPVTIASNNSNALWAKSGDTVTLSFTANEPIQTPAVTLLGSAATVANAGGNNWTATATVGAGTVEGAATFSIAASDLSGNVASAVTTTTDASVVTVDKTPPLLTPPGNMIVGANGTTGAVVSFSASASDNLDLAPVLVANPASDSLFPIGVTTVNLSLADAAGHASVGSFTVTVQEQTNAPNFITAGTVPLTANGFTPTGFTVGAVTLGFDPAPGQVLTLVNNTSGNPIVGAFTDLPDGGTVLTNHGGRSLLFQASYSGGDGNDLTLTLLNPEITVEEPLLADIPDGGSKSFGTMVLGSPVSLVFTVKNTGPGILNGLTITKSGTDQSAFTVTASPTAPVAGPSGSTTFTVQFNPATSGAKTATIHIPSDDGDENPFDITLTGHALSANDDTDADGLNDAAEFLMNALGYDWQVSQPSLVNALMTNANVANLFTPTQVQALHVGTPLIQRNPATGKFKLTMDWKKSTDLSSFLDFPAPSGSSVSISPQGDVEFEFPSSDNAAFFRIGVE